MNARQCPKVGQRVRYSAWGVLGAREGEVIRVVPMSRPVGGSYHRVRVIWDNGTTSTHDERVLEVIS